MIDAGTARASTDLSCVPCPEGSFSAQNGSAACTPAPAGTFINVTGSTQPTPCPAGARCSPSPIDHLSAACTTSVLQATSPFDPASGSKCATVCLAGDIHPDFEQALIRMAELGNAFNVGVLPEMIRLTIASQSPGVPYTDP